MNREYANANEVVRMQSLGLMETIETEDRVTVYMPEKSKPDPHAPLGFTARQFHLETTDKQNRFDWLFGVGLPLLCAAADPIVFRTWSGFGRPLLEDFKTFAYLLSIVSIMSMAAWLLWGQRLGQLRPYLGGLFLAGSAVSLIVGLILLPFSVIGTIMVIGLLGFTPLFSSFVYLRNGVRAIKGSNLELPSEYVFGAVIIAILYSLIVPYVLNF